MEGELSQAEREETPGIQFQRATLEDIPTLISIEQKVANLKTYSAMTDQKEWEAEIGKNNAMVYLILKDNIPVGDASYEKRNDDNAYISGLVIDPKFQGMGIGHEAMKHILEELRDVKTIELVTHPKNKAAIDLYLSLGFMIKERKENYFGDGEPRVILIKEKNENGN